MDCSNARERIGDLDDDLWRLEWLSESGERCTWYYVDCDAADDHRNTLISIGLHPTLRRYRAWPDETLEPWMRDHGGTAGTQP